MRRYIVVLFVFWIGWAATAAAGEADVIRATADKNADGRYRFSVTVSHADTGWDHYADKWELLDPDGTVLGIRILHHPHVDEQPFTRSLTGVTVAGHIKTIIVRAHDSVHGYGGKTARIELP